MTTVRHLTRHLTFANVAAGTALAVAVLGSGYAVAAVSLAPNSVGSAQIRSNAVRSSDIKNNGVTGKDIKESTLGTVPKASSASSLDKVTFAPKVTAAVGQTVTIATKGPLTVSLKCTDLGANSIEARVLGTTSVNGASFDANVSGSDSNVTNVGDQISLGAGSATGQETEHIGFAALTPDGQLWQGYGMSSSLFAGSTGCAAELVFIG